MTIIDRFFCWAEGPYPGPLSSITAEAIAEAFFAQWIARFGVPTTILTDQGRQFKSSLFKALSALLDIKKLRTSAYHPQSNGKLERWHRTLKTALKAHGNERWTEVLPTVLLGLRCVIREDAQATPAEMLYGTGICLPGEFLHSTSTNSSLEPSSFAQQLKVRMAKVKPVPSSHHDHVSVFVSPEFTNCTHVFVRKDSVKKPLQHPYDGPFRVINRSNKYFTVDIAGKQNNISLDRLKPAFVFKSDPVAHDHSYAAVNDVNITKPKSVQFL